MISPHDAKRTRIIGFVAQILHRFGSRNVATFLKVFINDTPLTLAGKFTGSARPLRVEIG